MRIKATAPFYLLSLFFLLVAFIFAVMHWVGGFNLLLSGFIVEIIFIILLTSEIYTSKQGSPAAKLIWIAFYWLYILLSVLLFFVFSWLYKYCLYVLASSFLTGLMYLTTGRMKFAPKEREIDKIKFDSF